MRNSRKKASSSRGSVLVLFALVLVLGAVVYFMNPLGSRDYIADMIGIELGEEKKQPIATPQSSATPRPSPSVEPVATEVKKEDNPSDDAEVQTDGIVLSRARSPVAASTADLSVIKPYSIGAEQTFSFQEWMKISKLQPDENAFNQLASLFMETGLKAGLIVGERYIHLEMPEYANPGFDVSVTPKTRDLKMHNPYKFDVVWELSDDNGIPVAQMSGKAGSLWAAPKIEVKPTVFAPDTVVLIDFANTTPQRGREAQLVKVYEGSKLLYKDFYAPVEEELLLVPTEEERKGLNHNGARTEEKK